MDDGTGSFRLGRALDGLAQPIPHISPLPDVLARILDHMELGHDIVTRLALLDAD